MQTTLARKANDMAATDTQRSEVLWDDGIAFGLGLFETIAVEHGRPVFLEEHLARLVSGARRLGIEAEGRVNAGDVLSRIAREDMARGAMKLVLTPSNLLMLPRSNPYDDAARGQGFRLRFSKVRRNETSPLTYLKSMNYGDSLMEKRAAHKSGFDEPLFLNTSGFVAEGATTNVFWAKGGRLFTPPVKAGLLPGVMRAYVMSQCAVEERMAPGEELLDADEVFVTNSLLGVMPASSLEGHAYDAANRHFSREAWQSYAAHLAELV